MLELAHEVFVFAGRGTDAELEFGLRLARLHDAFEGPQEAYGGGVERGETSARDGKQHARHVMQRAAARRQLGRKAMHGHVV